MDLKELNNLLLNTKVRIESWSTDTYEELGSGFDKLFDIYNNAVKPSKIKQLCGLPFEYVRTITWHGENEGDIHGQHVFKLDGLLLAVDFFRDSWDGSSNGDWAYPVVEVLINRSRDQKEYAVVSVENE